MQTATAAYPSPDLARFGRELEAVHRDASELLDGLSDAQLAWRPEAGGWSLGEVACHLRTLNARYLEAIDQSITEARTRGHTGFGGYKPGLLGGFMVKMMEPPVKRRLKTPAVFRPAEDEAHDWRAEVDGYLATHEGLEERLHRAGGISLARARVSSPASRLLRLTLGDAFALVLAHERRHLAQIRALRADPAFPRA
jgi:hypothetical protein